MKWMMYGIWFVLYGTAIDLFSTVVGAGFFGMTELNPLGLNYVIIFNLVAMTFFVCMIPFADKKPDVKWAGMVLCWVGTVKYLMGAWNLLAIVMG